MSDYSDDDDTPSFAPLPAPPRTAPITPVAPDGSVREETFSVEAPGAVVKVQLVCLKDQLYVWVGAVGADASARRDDMAAGGPPASVALTGRGG